MHSISISDLDIIFGKAPKKALALIDQGFNRHTIREKTGQVVGVQQINLSIHQGEIFVLMGASGSGKSTLLRAINGLMPISRGTIHLLLDGPCPEHLSLAEADKNTLRRLRMQHVAMVFQHFSLLPWKTVLENVGLGLEIAGIKKSVRDQRARECLELVGLESWAPHYPRELSGGMQQRVGLARALATNAPILLMDEPFSGLDPLLRGHLQQELLRLQKTLQKTIIFVSHDLEEAIKVGSRIAVLQDGKIVQIGTPEEIVSHPKNQYIKDFVQSVDPTRLLKARAVMTSVDDLKFSTDHLTVFLDHQGAYRCLLDEGGRPRRSICEFGEGRVVPWALFQSGSFSENDIILGHEHLMIKDVINAVGRTKKPIIIQDKMGKMVGSISTDSILKALSNK